MPEGQKKLSHNTETRIEELSKRVRELDMKIDTLSQYIGVYLMPDHRVTGYDVKKVRNYSVGTCEDKCAETNG